MFVVPGGRAALTGLMLGAITAFITRPQVRPGSSRRAAAGAVLSFFGFIHGTSLGIGNAAAVALGYLIVTDLCFALGRRIYPETVIPANHAVAED